jgi:hypothetical protein
MEYDVTLPHLLSPSIPLHPRFSFQEYQVSGVWFTSWMMTWPRGTLTGSNSRASLIRRATGWPASAGTCLKKATWSAWWRALSSANRRRKSSLSTTSSSLGSCKDRSTVMSHHSSRFTLHTDHSSQFALTLHTSHRSQFTVHTDHRSQVAVQFLIKLIDRMICQQAQRVNPLHHKQPRGFLQAPGPTVPHYDTISQIPYQHSVMPNRDMMKSLVSLLAVILRAEEQRHLHV